MNKPEFNLLDEPWIRVISSDCSVNEVGLKDVFENAHIYKSLAGDMPTQDVCLLRLLIAIVHCVITPESSNGFQSEDDALSAYAEIWDRGRFSERVGNYLERFREKFWLFNDIHPFYQITSTDGTKTTAAKLNGELSESNNKVKIFANRSGVGKSLLTYAQAARWLLHFIGFDDTSAKPKQKGAPSPGTGWVGKLGIVYAEGRNLFETILLNTVLLDEDGRPWNRGSAPWERDSINEDERVLVGLPNSQIEILCVQSRKVVLQRDCERGFVSGLANLGGDFWDKRNSFAEQMTLWRYKKEDKEEPAHYVPKRHMPDRFAWHEFGTLTAKSEEETHRPGIVSWLSHLQGREKIIEKKHPIHFVFVGMQYGDKDFFANDVYSDSISFSASILDGLKSAWQKMITTRVESIVEVADLLAKLNNNIIIASGGDNKKFYAGNVYSEFYGQIDTPFKNWIVALRPDEDDIELVKSVWNTTMFDIAEKLARKLIDAAPPHSMRLKTKSDDKGKLCLGFPLPRAYDLFLFDLKKKLLPKETEKNND